MVEDGGANRATIAKTARSWRIPNNLLLRRKNQTKVWYQTLDGGEEIESCPVAQRWPDADNAQRSCIKNFGGLEADVY